MENWLRMAAHDQSYGVWDSDKNPIDPDDLPISADLTLARAASRASRHASNARISSVMAAYQN